MIRTGLRVGFTGAGGTGKTTSANDVAKATGLTPIKSASRIVYEQDKLTEELCAKLPDEEKYKLQFRIFQIKEELDKGTFAFVADRTLLDHWAYCLMYCGAFIPNEAFKEFNERVRVHMRSQYTHVFYFPWGYFEPTGDGVRQDHHSWQSAIDAVIFAHLHHWGIPTIEVPQTGGKEARAKFIIDTIRNRP